ncbi:hypothetical protein SDC9_127228 [bioreactor metagenome]|uniref:Uncharacterized protein n=1 Tax=bioreactor metagenome TaxID=1076179 RepID=A0A645CTE4_9ZZZZ
MAAADHGVDRQLEDVASGHVNVVLVVAHRFLGRGQAAAAGREIQNFKGAAVGAEIA